MGTKINVIHSFMKKLLSCIPNKLQKENWNASRLIESERPFSRIGLKPMS